MQARLLSKKPCPVIFSSHSCLRPEENKQAWVFLKGKLCLSLVGYVQCRVWWERESSSRQERGFSNWLLPEATLFQVWRPQNRIRRQNPNMTHFPCASEIGPGLTSYPMTLSGDFTIWIIDLMWGSKVSSTVRSRVLNWKNITWRDSSKFIDLVPHSGPIESESLRPRLL